MESTTSEEEIVLSYPETMEILVQDSVNLLTNLIKDKTYYISVSKEILIEDHLNLCAELGWKPNEQTS